MSIRKAATASRRSRVEPFRAMAVLAAANARAARGQAVVHLEVGEPGGTLPAPVRDAIAARLLEAPLGYTEALGMPALREAISALYADWYGVDVPPSRIAVTVGASGAFVLALLAGFDPGARIGITEPGYPAYKTMASALDLTPVILRPDRLCAFQPVPKDLAGAAPLDGLILASPANPTGAVLGRADLQALVRACRASSTRIIADEIYHGLIFEKQTITLAAEAPEAIVINSFSKYFGLTGWRVGWLVLPTDLVETVERLAQNLFISAPAPAQHAALAALAHKHLFADRCAVYRQNWQVLATGLRSAGVSGDAIIPADGAFYLYADLGAFTLSTNELCARMLDEVGVAATPGLDFDATSGDRWVRFSVSGEPRAIADASAKLSTWLARQRRGAAR